MNENLKQSLEERLGGMRWGERDQTEVFRQIQRKELQDMKHVKRGTGLLAIALAMLFIVMGAAFALTTLPQSEDARVSGQPETGEFVPVPAARYENEYFTLTIDSTHFESTELSFTGTIRMKEPEDYMLFSFGGHTPPGDPGRTPIRVSLRASAETIAADMRVVSGCDLDNTPDVLSMTSDSATFRMSGTPVSTGPEMHIALQVTYTDPATGTERMGTITWTMNASDALRIVLLENKYITATLVERRTEGAQSIVTIEITPSKPWYTLNRIEDGKATLQVHVGNLQLYACNSHNELLEMVELRQPPLGEMDGSISLTSTGLRYTVQGEVPAGYDSLLGYLDITIAPDAEAIHDNSDLPHYAEVIVPMPDPAVNAALATAPTPTPSPIPAATARPTPSGERIGMAEIVSVYLEDSWSDGYTTEATMRLRANDPNHRLAIAPNASGAPDGSTWVVQLTGSGHNAISTDIRLTLDETTGDVLADITLLDLYDVYQDGLLDLILTTTNELTWEQYSIPFRPVMRVSRTYTPIPLHLVSSSVDGVFMQGAMQTSERYCYIGVMLDHDAGSSLQGALLNPDGAELATNSGYADFGKGVKTFPNALFPYDGDDNAQFTLLVLRLDKDTDLSKLLPVRLTRESPGNSRESIADIMLSTRAIQPLSNERVIFNLPLLTATLLHTDYVDGYTAAQMQFCLKDPFTYTLDPNDPDESKLYIELSPALCAYNGDDRPMEYVGDCTVTTDVQSDVCTVTFYGRFPDWLPGDSDEMWCIALLSARAEDGSFRESYNASFSLPQTGEIRFRPVSLLADGFSLDSGLLLQTDYLNVLSIRWTGDHGVGMLYKNDHPAELQRTMTFIRGEIPAQTEVQAMEYHLPDFDEEAIYSLLVFIPNNGGRQMYPLQIGSAID